MSHAARVIVLLVVMSWVGDGAAHVHAHPGHHAPAAGAEEGAGTLRDTQAWLQARLASAPESPLLLSKLGGVHLAIARRSGMHEDYEDAADCFERLLAADGESVTGRVGRAYARLGLHRFRGALEDARRAALSEPDDATVLALLADVHLALGHVVEAEVIARSLLERSITLESLARVAVIAYERSRYEEARVLLLDALEAGRLLEADEAARAWCLTMLGDVARESGDLEEAEARYREAMATSGTAHAAAWSLGRLLHDRGDLAEAIVVLREVVGRADRVPYRIALGEALCDAGASGEGSRLLSEAEAELEHEIDHGEMGHARALVELWLWRGDHLERAAGLAGRELAAVRGDHGAYEVAGWAMFRAGHVQEAVPLMRQALRLSPAHPPPPGSSPARAPP